MGARGAVLGAVSSLGVMWHVVSPGVERPRNQVFLLGTRGTLPHLAQWRTGERASEMESYGVCVSASETDRRDPRPCISLALTQTP